jgi:hypothetical protein
MSIDLPDTTEGCPTHLSAPLAARSERLALDLRGQHAESALRWAAAVVAFAAGAWLIAVSRNYWQSAFAIASLGFAALFVVRARRQRARAQDASRHFLDIGEQHLALAEGDQARSLAWADVETVEIDDDRLVVVLRLRDRAPWIIEPYYGGLALRPLAERLHTALERSRAHTQAQASATNSPPERPTNEDA